MAHTRDGGMADPPPLCAGLTTVSLRWIIHETVIVRAFAEVRRRCMDIRGALRYSETSTAHYGRATDAGFSPLSICSFSRLICHFLSFGSALSICLTHKVLNLGPQGTE